MELGEIEQLRGGLGEFVAEVFASVPRRDQRAKGDCYLRGLMLDGRRKSIQRLPDGDMQALQQFVNQSPWDHVAVLRAVAVKAVPVVNGTDHRSHGEQNAAIAAYVRWRNARAEPKTNFAPDSPIRSWTDYPAKAA
ncbi:hypothetical protein CGZ69_31620 [Streptomyces peucetius subsp. caesius ATCC 27952]|nr:hypothetical protein CGZ69_31620 [Streptomyces peucetius subsp. caesius ATCC 27952]